jgi:hypothetical protein
MSSGTDYNEVFEDSADSSTERTIHRVRANSTIMHLNKILGLFSLKFGRWRDGGDGYVGGVGRKGRIGELMN